MKAVLCGIWFIAVLWYVGSEAWLCPYLVKTSAVATVNGGEAELAAQRGAQILQAWLPLAGLISAAIVTLCHLLSMWQSRRLHRQRIDEMSRSIHV